MRRYFSILNFLDIFKTFFGVLTSLWTLFKIYPDVIFSKGSYPSFPPLFAARILRIPVVIHESDTVPGRANSWAGKFAKRIAVSYPETAHFFNKEKVAFTGNPIRKEVKEVLPQGAYEFLNLEQNVPVIAFLGGSLGSGLINEVLMQALPKLVEKYQIIHQTGKKNLTETKNISEVILDKNPLKNRYKPFDYLNNLAMRMTAGVSSVIVSRAGSTIFEIAQWGIPSILIPITDSNGDHQRKNAYAYSRTGAARVIEEKNFSEAILRSEIERIIHDPNILKGMQESARKFARPDAAKKIAEEILSIALEHDIRTK
jgi:UDP-N-acetylglucosamine--N-acetylmuramyl-(pentapeptide) pyrophosphoryl-undecaprenol N-acetylglucosamine transferase